MIERAEEEEMDGVWSEGWVEEEAVVMGLFMCSSINLCQSAGQYCLWSRPVDGAVNDGYGNNLFTQVA